MAARRSRVIGLSRLHRLDGRARVERRLSHERFARSSPRLESRGPRGGDVRIRIRARAALRRVPGQLYETHFVAHNLTGSPLAAQAVPSVAPGAAARYFNKAECFCFTSQDFAPHEELRLKLSFMVGAELPAHVDTLSLSYTYFSASN